MRRLINPDYKKEKENLLQNLEEKQEMIELTKINEKNGDSDEKDSSIILSEEFGSELNSSSGNIQYI